MKYFNKTGKEYHINLSKEIARGGEGMIIEIGKNTAAKLYFPNRTPLSEKKFNELVVLSDEFIKPLEILYSQTQVPLGFTMKLLATGSFPIHSVFNSGFCNKTNLDDKWKLNIIEKLIKGMSGAHSKNIVIGDFNGFNLLTYSNGDLFFIDVDSYETPSFKHSGILFDDIRDHLYHGKVSKESDYFGLAVLSFSMLTYVHPYKGVHQKVAATADRMIQKIPVFDSDKNLIVPKCYKPISNNFLMDQFIKIFKKGERFPLQLVQGITIRVAGTMGPVAIETAALIMKEMYSSPSIRYVKTSDLYCVVVENTFITVFNVQVKSIFNINYQIPNDSSIKEIFVNNTNVFVLKDRSLNAITKSAAGMIYLEQLEQLEPGYLWYQQYENILVIGYEDYMMKFYLDDVILSMKKIRSSKDSIFGKRFTKYNGLVQHISGVDFIFYNSNNILNTVKFPYRLHDIIQHGNFGVAEYFDDKNILRHSMFNINGLEVILNPVDIGRFSNFDFKRDYVLSAESDALIFDRPSDFATIVKYECKVVDEDSDLFITNAGIIAKTDDKLYLINKK